MGIPLFSLAYTRMISFFSICFLFVLHQFVNAETYSIAYIDNNLGMDSYVTVNSVTYDFMYVGIGRYYNFDYNIGDSLSVRTIIDGSHDGYFLIKNGANGAGKTIYDSRAKSFYVVNNCPETETECKFVLNGYDELSPATVDVYVNNQLVVSDYSSGQVEFIVKPDDAVKVIVNGIPSENRAVMSFTLTNVAGNEQYDIFFWYYNNFVSAAVIETVGIFAPVKGGHVIAGEGNTIELISTPIADVYNVQMTCENFPPVTQSILSNEGGSFLIPQDYYGLPCLLSIVDTLSGVNTVEVLIVLSSDQMKKCARHFVLHDPFISKD